MNKQKGMLKLGEKSVCFKKPAFDRSWCVEPICCNLLVHNRNAKRFTEIQNSRLMAKLE